MAGKAVSLVQELDRVAMSQPRLGASDNIPICFSETFSFPPHSSHEFQQRYQSPRTGKVFISNAPENIEGCISTQS